MTTNRKPTAEQLAHDPFSFLPPRYTEILGDDECERGPRPSTRRDSGTGIFYRPDVLVTRAEFADDVARFLDRRKVRYRRLGPLFDENGSPTGDTKPPDRRRPARGRAGRFAFRALQSVVGFALEEASRERDSLELARMVKAAGGDNESAVPEGVVAGPMHVLTLAPRISIGPGSDPLPATPDNGLPGQGARSRTEAARIGVVDTGLWEKALGWSFVSGDAEVPMPAAGSVVPWRASGHGGYIAWLANCVSPGSQIRVLNAFTSFDPTDATAGLTEVSVIADVNELIIDGYRIINLSLGTKVDTAFSADLVVFDAAMEDWHRIKGVLIVAAAGNDASTDPWYPAGYAADRRYASSVVSVGALEGAGGHRLDPIHSRVATFSNHGPWVTAWAPGVDLVSAYPPEVKFEYTDDLGNTVDTRSFDDGLAYWSGTSFATPVVAAQIAVETGAKGDARKVWADWRRGRPFVVVWPTWWDGDEKPCVP